MTLIRHLSDSKPNGFLINDLEEPVTPPVTELNVVEPNVGLIVATVVLVICIA
jgi:hypothetical protein